MIPVILAVMTGMVLFILFAAFRSLGEHKKNIDTTNWHLSSLKNELDQKGKETAEAIDIKDNLQKELDSLKHALADKEQAYQEIKTRCAQWEKDAETKGELAMQLEQEKKQGIEQAGKCRKLEKDLQSKQEEITLLEQKNKQVEQNIERLDKELNEARKELVSEKQKTELRKKEPALSPLPELKKDISAPIAAHVPQEQPTRTEEKKQAPFLVLQDDLAQQAENKDAGAVQEEPKEKIKPSSTDSPFSRFLKPRIRE
ncbi:MAG: hypothetical protein V1662_03100 [Candidatus Omnitrophota bacterium]